MVQRRHRTPTIFRSTPGQGRIPRPPLRLELLEDRCLLANITTFAGSGGYYGTGSSGDGGPATSAVLDGTAVAVDASGNVYIADAGNNNVRKVNPAGIISTIAGNGTRGFSGDGGLAVNAELDYPDGVAVDGNGNVFVSELVKDCWSRTLEEDCTKRR